jgi:exopolysaccharide production protein ExoZ
MLQTPAAPTQTAAMAAPIPTLTTVSPAQRLQSIEAARGLAALAVLLMHSANLMNTERFSGHIGVGGLFNFGYVGVDFFFVLSGFIISYVHQRDLGKPSRLPVYLWRRVVRIFPILWFNLALALVVTAGGRLLLGKPAGLDFGLQDVLTNILLLPLDEPRFLGVAWSLQYEVMFYVLFAPLLANRRLGFMLLGGWAALILLRWRMPSLPNAAGLLNAHSLQFLFGVVLGLSARQPWFPTLRSRWLLPALALLVASVWLERAVWTPHSPAGRVALGLASAAVLGCLIGIERHDMLLRTPAWLAQLGAVSYSVYLGHITILGVVYMGLNQLGLYHRLPEWLVFVIGAGTALAVTVQIGLRVELPMIRRLRGLVSGA